MRLVDFSLRVGNDDLRSVYIGLILTAVTH